MRVLTLTILLLFSTLLKAQNGVSLFHNARTTALGNSDITSHNVLSGSINPANTIIGHGLFASLGIQRSFLIADINQGSLDVGYRMKNDQAIGLQFYVYGNNIYSEAMASLAYAIRIADKTSLGLRMHGLRFSAPENKPEYAVTFTLGAQTVISEQFSLGMTTFNPVGFFRKERPNDLTSNFRIGLAYSPAPSVSLYTSANLDDAHPLNVALGIAYSINKKVNLYLSFMTQPAVIGVGIGVPFGRGFSIDIAGAQHLQLGLSPALNLNYLEVE